MKNSSQADQPLYCFKIMIICCVNSVSESELEGGERESVWEEKACHFSRELYSLNTARNHNTSSAPPHTADEYPCFLLLCSSPLKPLLQNDVIWCLKLTLIWLCILFNWGSPSLVNVISFPVFLLTARLLLPVTDFLFRILTFPSYLISCCGWPFMCQCPF